MLVFRNMINATSPRAQGRRPVDVHEVIEGLAVTAQSLVTAYYSNKWRGASSRPLGGRPRLLIRSFELCWGDLAARRGGYEC